MKMKYSLTTLYVKDMDESLKFYRDLIGMDVLNEVDAGPMRLAFLGEKDEPNLELIASPEHKDNTYKGFSIGFDVESLEEATKLMVENGYRHLSGPISPNPSTQFSFFEGPDGVGIELLEHKD